MDTLDAGSEAPYGNEMVKWDKIVFLGYLLGMRRPPYFSLFYKVFEMFTRVPELEGARLNLMEI